EDVVELRLTGDEIVETGLTRLAEILDDAVDQLRVADLVLHLGGEGELSLQGWCPEDPLALGEDAHELRVPVHLDELDERFAVVLGHGIAGLDLASALDVRFEFGFAHTQTIVR